MAKKLNSNTSPDVPEGSVVKVIKLTRGEGAYGFNIYEVPEAVFNQHAQVIEKLEPDIYHIFVNNIIAATRRLFGF